MKLRLQEQEPCGNVASFDLHLHLDHLINEETHGGKMTCLRSAG